MMINNAFDQMYFISRTFFLSYPYVTVTAVLAYLVAKSTFTLLLVTQSNV